MNIAMFVISSLVFIISLRLTYEVWLFPKKYIERLDRQRKSTKTLLGFSYWKEGRINFAIAKPVSIFMLIMSLIGIIFSSTGPITIIRSLAIRRANSIA